MRSKTKKRLLICGIILIALTGIGVISFHVVVNTVFSKVTQSIGDSDLLKNEAGEMIFQIPASDGSETVDVHIDSETLTRLEEEIPVGDKYNVLMLLANALPQEEYSLLLSYITGGISKDEFDSAYSIMRKNLSKEEKAEIKAYYAKYLHLLEE